MVILLGGGEFVIVMIWGVDRVVRIKVKEVNVIILDISKVIMRFEL